MLSAEQKSVVAAWLGNLPPSVCSQAERSRKEMPMSNASDFDFLIGNWSVLHRRLKLRLVGSDQWEEFPGTVACRKIPGGMGNRDDNFLELLGDPYYAMTVRTFDPKNDEWSIWWFDGRHPGTLDAPVKGGFLDRIGTFLAADNYEGTPIKVRFRWDAREANAPRWEQAFSTDDGRAWETNWVMLFSKAG
jgi:hypothetical protein